MSTDWQAVIRRFDQRLLHVAHGRADEVGLGKTVEAGLILSELLMRGLVRSVLVLTPPSLIALMLWSSHDRAVLKMRLNRG